VSGFEPDYPVLVENFSSNRTQIQTLNFWLPHGACIRSRVSGFDVPTWQPYPCATRG